MISTKIHHLNGKVIDTNQYAVTQNEAPASSIPSKMASAFFHYDISPVLVQSRQTRKSIFSILFTILSVFGGVYIIAAVIDAIVFYSERKIAQKSIVGKNY